mgnify:CR=1 FL=1
MVIVVPNLRQLIKAEKKPRRILRVLAEGVTDDPYLHRDALDRLQPPGKLTREQWWMALKLARASRAQALALPSSGAGWHYSPVPSSLRLTDLLIGSAPMGEGRFVLSAQTREAIYSCRLDGIVLADDEATRQALRARRVPTGPAERVGWNLFQALRSETSSLGMRSIDELAVQLTAGTEDEGTWPGLSKELVDALTPFLEGTIGRGYVPPIVRATAVYAAVREALDNWPPGGRMARAVFVWSGVQLGIGVIPTLAWSKTLASAPKKVKRTLKQTLSDEHDLTYFLLHHLETLELALRERDQRFNRKRLAEKELTFPPVDELNERQRALLYRARHRPDMLGLVRLGLLRQEKHGRAFVYRLAEENS